MWGKNILKGLLQSPRSWNEIDIQEFARGKMVEGSAKHPHQENPTWLVPLATEIGFQVSREEEWVGRGVGEGRKRNSSGVLVSVNSYLSVMEL